MARDARQANGFERCEVGESVHKDTRPPSPSLLCCGVQGFSESVRSVQRVWCGSSQGWKQGEVLVRNEDALQTRNGERRVRTCQGSHSSGDTGEHTEAQDHEAGEVVTHVHDHRLPDRTLHAGRPHRRRRRVGTSEEDTCDGEGGAEGGVRHVVERDRGGIGGETEGEGPVSRPLRLARPHRS